MEESYLKIEQIIQEEYQNTAGLMIVKDGETLYEKYFNDCDLNSKIHVYSVSKSVLSILIGIAIDKGYIKSVHQKVLEFFPDYKVKKGEHTIQQITIEHLLTMVAPYHYKDTPLLYMRYFMSHDWIKFTLDRLGGNNAIGSFRYTPLVGPDILSGILCKACGQSVFDFAQTHLFQPLDLCVEQSLILKSMKQQMDFNKSTSISAWVCDDKKTQAGGWGLTLCLRDMAKLGQLFLNDGQWFDQPIVSKHWIDLCIKKHSEWPEKALSYGYLWWIIKEADQACAALGDGGNTIYFNKKKNLVVAISSLFIPNAQDRIDFIQTNIEPLFDATSELEAL